MRPLKTSFAALAVAALAAMPALADTVTPSSPGGVGYQRTEGKTGAPQDAMTQQRYYSQDESTYAVLDPVAAVWNVFDATTDALVEAIPEADYQPYEPGYREVVVHPMTRPEQKTGVLEKRYYSQDESTYAVLDPDTSIWNVFDADTDEMIDSVPKGEYQPYEPGYREVAVNEMTRPEKKTGVIAESPKPVMKGEQGLRAGMAQERYYNKDRSTYAMFDESASVWNIYDASTDEKVASKRDYKPYRPGYTVYVPGMESVGMGSEGESIADDTPGISDNRE